MRPATTLVITAAVMLSVLLLAHNAEPAHALQRLHINTFNGTTCSSSKLLQAQVWVTEGCHRRVRVRVDSNGVKIEETYYGKAYCNATHVTRKIFALSDTTCQTATETNYYTPNQCTAETSYYSVKAYCSAGNVAWASVLIVLVMILMMVTV